MNAHAFVDIIGLESGEADAARALLAKFRWGESFLVLNKELLDAYATCSNSADVIRVQGDRLRQMENEAVARRSQAIDLPPSGSSDSE